MKSTLLKLALFFSIVMGAQTAVPPADWQIKTAVLSVPEEFRDAAKVYGYDANGDFVTLREGANQYICIADNPKKDGFEVASYHKDLDVFMARGRELKAQGKGFKEIFDMREEEVKSGRLFMPDKSTLAVFMGTVNKDSKEIENQRIRYVVYIPFATAESTGLPASPKAAGHPWIMNPGTHRAHIMITPANPNMKKK